MKVQNPTKLDIFFKGGGIIKFPVQNLKQIDIEPIDEQGGGESPDQPTKIDTIKNYVNILYDYYNIEFDVVEETSTNDEDVQDENGDSTGEVVTVTTKTYKFVPKTDVPKVYLNGDDASGYTSVVRRIDGLELHATDSRGAGPYPDGISKIMLNDTELTIQQLLNNYNIVQVGTAKFEINVPNYNFDDYIGYLEYLDWIRNNTIEIAEVPILLYGDAPDGTTRNYHGSFGFNDSRLFLNGNNAFYSQTVYDVINQVI